ncbi:hypothetical protein ACXR2T_12560 [Leucobacter sp. HY1910]
MTESPYEHLFVRKLRDCRLDMVNEGEAAGRPLPANLSAPWALMSSTEVPEAKAYLTMSWVHPTDERVDWVHEHEHDYDEVLTWTGSNPDDPSDLGAELFIDVEGERHIITTSGSLYVPAGTKHCPLGFNRVDRPFRFMALALSGDGQYLPANEREERSE